MNKRLKIAQGGGDAAYSGSGKLSDFRQDGSWMMNQMEKGYDKVERGVTVDKSTGNIVFSNVHTSNNSNDGFVFSHVHDSNSKLKENNVVSNTSKRIAAKLITSSEDFKIVKYFKFLQLNQDYITVAFKICLYGQLDGSTIADLNLAKDFLYNRYYYDCKNLESYFDIHPTYMGDVCIDFHKNCVRLQILMDIEADENYLYQALTSELFDYQSADNQEVM